MTTTTRIGSSPADTSRLRMRGADVLTDIVGRKSFAETFYFIVTGRWPNEAQHRIFDAALVVLMDHGLTQSAVVARFVADSVPNDIQISMAAGMLMVGDRFAGTMAGMGALLLEGDAADDKHAWAAATVARFKTEKRRMPGFGHPFYKDVDPRARRLAEFTRSTTPDGRFLDLLDLLSQETDRAAGRSIIVNATAVLGAMLCEIGFPVEAMRAVAAVSRAAGLAAHAYEESHNPLVPAIFSAATGIDYSEDN